MELPGAGPDLASLQGRARQVAETPAASPWSYQDSIGPLTTPARPDDEAVPIKDPRIPASADAEARRAEPQRAA